MALEIVARKNGPFLVTGDLSQLELRDGDGNLYDFEGPRVPVPLRRLDHQAVL